MSIQKEGLEFNSKGYLINFDAWNRDVAIAMAKEHGLELTECHWHVINFLRDYHLEYGVAPGPRDIIHKLGKKIHPGASCKKQHLENLFAQGGCKLACKMAGLPDSFCRSC